jgi:Necrosis inducing protein (NPP1)
MIQTYATAMTRKTVAKKPIRHKRSLWQTLGFFAPLIMVLGLATPGFNSPESDGPVDMYVAQLTTPPMSTEILLHWAPVLYQDVNTSHCKGVCDYISAIDYDGDFQGRNNWDNTELFPHPAVAYAAASESATHWFLYYAFYHPRDYVSSGFGDGEHEHDMEGALVFVRKDVSVHGFFEGMITFAHSRMWPYRTPAADYIVRGELAILADRGLRVLQTETLTGEGHARPALYQEAQGHGVYSCGHKPCPKPGDNGIRYVPSLSHDQTPLTPVPSATSVTVSYSLIDMTAKGGLWNMRSCRSMFGDPNTFNGDESGTCGDGLAFCQDNAIGIWANRDKEGRKFSNLSVGEDPAAVVNDWFSFSGGHGPASADYVNHIFCTGHDLCEQGALVPASCGGCAARICAVDPFCCNNSWDSECVNQVASVCGSDACAGRSCAHDVCTTGPALAHSCSHCAAQICEKDPFCCSTDWDSQCASQVNTVCRLRCSVPSECTQ